MYVSTNEPWHDMNDVPGLSQLSYALISCVLKKKQNVRELWNKR